MKVSKGTVYTRKDSPYLYLNFSINKKRVSYKTDYRKDEIDKSKVEEKLLPLIREKIINGEISLIKETENKNFEYYSQNFLNIKRKTVRESTFYRYQQYLNIWQQYFKDKDIKSIKTSHIEDKLYSFEIGKSATNLHLTILKGVFKQAIKDEAIKNDPTLLVERPKEQKKKEVFPFEKDEVDQLLQESTGWFKVFLATAFFTGLRTGELLALQWQNIDLKRKRIFVDKSRNSKGVISDTKTGTTRYVPIFDALIPYLEEQQMKTGLKTFVFYTDFGKEPTQVNVFTRYWKPLLKRVKIPYRNIYQTRHTFATTLLNSGSFTMNQISSMLGHKNLQMLIKHYNKYMQKDLDKIDTNFNPFKSENCNDFCNDAVLSPISRAV